MASSPFLSQIPINNKTISFSSSLSPAFPFPPSTLSHRRRNPNALRVQAKIREIFMPALSSTMTEGKIVSWIKSEGDVLSKGESVVVVESDKADMDVETFYDGILAAIVVPEGETAPVGAPIGLLAETEEEIAEAKAKAASKAGGSSSPATPISPPATSTPAPAAISQPPPAPAAPEGPRKTTATPLPRLVGTGPYGRVTPADVEAAAGIAVSKPSVSPASPAAAAAPVKPVASSSAPPPLPGSNVVPFTSMQAAVSKNMVESLSVPTFRVGYPLTSDALDALYEKVKPKGVTMTALLAKLLAKAAAMALVQHPVVNASCKDGKSFTYNSNINIAVAVAINGGLITPVLQDADKLDLYLLSKKWKELVEKARAKQLQPQEYNSVGNNVQGAIMAVGASKPTAVADKDGFFSVKSKMLVNVTADHRIIYGADLAAFLQTFARIIENPESLTL
uniref:Dihydrolipoamide acetyltransferase component of pyruvate dehydrogenase complex n=1 Tax=Salix viminalis TaxID=40686 RepID=A0A6N2MXW7_SALVM